MSLAKKLQLPAGRPIHVLHPPAGLALDAERAPAPDGAVLVFVTNAAELDARALPALDAARADRLAWIAYPKGGQLGTDLNRDTLWERLKAEGVRPVRQVSIDEIWSALRFRPAV